MKKDRVIETINEFPAEFELESLIERLIFIEEVEDGLKQIEEGKLLTQEQVDTEIKKW